MNLPQAVKQKVLMSMDLLAGAISYGATYLGDDYDEGLRRCFLMTGGRTFISADRVRRAKARAEANRSTNSGAAQNLKDHIT